ncbi:MAG: FAD-binding oxidoreductase, partial [Actinomycetota bacterium]|nr:FAD-binding oxidoreductase [Actinomycetota bacterium]
MVDYVIVGGGVYGCAVAWGLSRRGHSVRVLESNHVASRASGGPGRRGVRANGRDPRELPLMTVAYDVWPTLHEELGAEQFYERVGQLLLLETPDQVSAAIARCRMQEALGIESHMVERDELREMEPELNDTIVGALFCPRDGVADHAATTRAYAGAAMAMGVELTEGCSMRSIEVTGGRATDVMTDDERIVVDRGVILLSNSEVAEQVHALGGPLLPVWNGCFQVLMSEPLESLPLRHLVGHVGRTVSLKADTGNRLMISGGWTGAWDAAAQTGRPRQAAVEGNVSEAVAVYPSLAGIEIGTVDVGHLEAVSADDVPIIDTVPHVDNLW